MLNYTEAIMAMGYAFSSCLNNAQMIHYDYVYMENTITPIIFMNKRRFNNLELPLVRAA